MPPFLTPVIAGERVLVDGGIINPVPCDVVRDMGADIVVAVNRDRTWIEFYRAPAIMEKGAVAGQEAIGVLKELLSRRLAESVPEQRVV